MKTVRQYSNLPAAVVFGSNTPDQAREIAKIADGVIVGSAIVKLDVYKRQLTESRGR